MQATLFLLTAQTCQFPAVAALEPAGYMHRKTMQFHWRNRNKETGRPYADFDDYLAAFRSKRRSKIKKEASGEQLCA